MEGLTHQLFGSSLTWLVATIAAFECGAWINRKAKGSPLCHPVILSMIILIALLSLLRVDYATYFEGAKFIHFLLGPATVALAIPLYDHFEQVRRLAIPVFISCVTGATVAAASAVGVAALMGGSRELLLSLAPKSVTTPIAIGIADKIGGLSPLTVGLVLITGVLGCVLAPLVFRLLKTSDERVQGFSLGIAAHGIGTAFAFRYGAMAGAFSGVAMGLTGTLSAFEIPFLAHLFNF